MESFPIDIDALKANKRLPVKGRLSLLLPYLDEEQSRREGGRLRKAPVSSDTRNPLVLHPKHHRTRLIVMHHHLRLYCTSSKHVPNEFKQTYWILKGLATVQMISSSCPSCRRGKVQPEPPVKADLPDSRLGYRQLPFTNTALIIDYFGPILVRNGRKLRSATVRFYTCLTTRTVHVKIAHSLDTDSYLMAMRRRMARRSEVITLFIHVKILSLKSLLITTNKHIHILTKRKKKLFYMNAVFEQELSL